MPRLTLLGGLDITLDGTKLQGFVSRKALALLVYLAVTGRAHRREALAGMLWGDRPQAHAASDLRVALSNLRRLLPGYLQTDRQTVALQPPAPLWVDVLELEQAVSSSRGPDDLAGLERALELYRGPFVEGFHLHGAPAFDEWVLVEQERLRSMAVQALRRLAQRRAARGEYAAAIAAARRLVALDPWHEEAHRELMGLLALSGQRSAALSQYETCRQLLAKDLGLEPLEETIALYERIRDTPGALSPPPLETTAWGPASLPFVGRREEHACLVQWWEAARRGHGRPALIAGEAGVGKTRLAEEVLRYAAARGATVLRGRCYEFGSGLPYQAIVQALRQTLELTPPAFDPQPATSSNLQPATFTWLRELVPLLPELRDRFPGLPPPAPTEAETARQRLFEAVARFVARYTPGILFLDDLHWADPATLDLLHYLARQPAGQPAPPHSFRNLSSPALPLWIVGTYRTEEVDLDHPLARLRQNLGRDHLVDQLALAPLALPAVQELAGALVAGAKGQTLADFLYRESAGNPFFLVETVDALWEQGLLQGETGALHWAGPPAAAPIPSSIQDIVLQRVGRLTKPAQRLLALAAAIGRPFDLPLLRAAAESDAAALPASLDEWLRRRMIQPVPTANLQLPTSSLHYDFAHDKIRAVIYGSTGPARRGELHRQVGQALEQLYRERSTAPYGELAYHFEQAGQRERALAYLPLAAAQALSVYDHLAALGHYDRALALATRRQDRSPLELERVRTLHLLGRYDEAAAAGEETWHTWMEEPPAPPLAAQLACEISAIHRARRDYTLARSWAERSQQRGGQGDTVWQEQAAAWQSLAVIEREQGRLEEAERLFQQTLDIQERRYDLAGQAECLKGLGHVLAQRGQQESARQRFETALALFCRLDDRQNEATCRRMIGMTWWRQGQHDAARQSYTASMEICQAIGDRAGEAAALNGLGLAAIAQGDQAETRRCWEESVTLYRTLGLEKRTAAGLHNLGILYMDMGDYEAAQRCLEESLTLDHCSGAQASEALDLGWLGRLHLLRGDYDVARRCLDKALALDQEIGGGEEETGHRAWRGAVAYETGDWVGAQTYLERAAALARQQGTDLGPAESCTLAQVYLAQGGGPAALAVIRQQMSADKDQHGGTLYAMLGTIHGSGLLPDAEEPTPCFEHALSLLRDKDPLGYGLALRRYGAYLLRRGEIESGRARLHEAMTVLQRIGARGEADKVTRLLNGDGSPQLAW